MKINQGAYFLKEVLRMATHGALLPASFQRPYVWGKADALALFESIQRGYPVGSFLTWSPYGAANLALVSRPRLGPVVGVAEKSAVSLLLDGQNRLATLAWLAFDFDQPLPSDLTEQEKATWADGSRLVVDLVTEELLFVPEAEAFTGMRMPAYTLTDSRLANQFIRKVWSTTWADYTDEQKEKGLRWQEDCANAFRNARVTVTDIEHADAHQAKDAFLHICKVGVPMSEKDFDAAIAWAT